MNSAISAVETGAAMRQPPAAGRREWVGPAVLTLPTVLIAVDMTVLHLAVPHLSADLRPTSSQLLWILDIYGFMIAGFLVAMGTLGDRIGRRRLLLAGAAAFGAASALAAFSTSAEMLIATRALLGIAGATLMPSTLSLIRNMFQRPSERTAAIAVWMTAFIVGSAIGPLVGGVMLEFFWWGSVFLLGVPVMALLLVTAPLLLPEFRDPEAGRLDLLSAALSVAAIIAVVYGLKEIAKTGPALWPALSILAGVAIGTAFVRRQRVLADPMFDLDLFRLRTFSASVAAIILSIFALSGAFLVIYQYMQGVLGLSPLMAGLWMLPATVGQVLAAMAVPGLAQRVPKVHLISFGLVAAAAGLLVMTQIDGPGALLLLVGATAVMGAGCMPIAILGTDLVVGSAPARKAGAASATSETAAELGMALGIAVIGSVGTAVYRGRIAEIMPAGVPEAAAAAARDTIGGAMAVAAELAPPLGPELLAAARIAFTQALHANAAIGALVVLATAGLSALLLRERRA